MNPASADVWADALTAVQLLALAPHRLGGVWLRAPHGPVRDAWLKVLAQQPRPLHRAPSSVDASRWLGGLDLTATLHSGVLRQQPGLLRQAHGGLLCLSMAERFPTTLTAILAQALDRGGVEAGNGFEPSRFGVVALDESLDDEAPLAAGLQERLGLWIDLREVPPAAAQVVRHSWPPVSTRPDATVVAGDSTLEAVCATALALGITSLRVPQLALEAAKGHAALRGRDHVADEDLGFACRTVLAPRATQWPASEVTEDTASTDPSAPPSTPDPPSSEAEPAHPPDIDRLEPPAPPPVTSPADSTSTNDDGDAPPPPREIDAQALQDMMVASAAARLPPDLLQRLMTGGAPPRTASRSGSSGQTRQGGQRGRPLPPRPGRPGSGARLHVLATLRAAAPHQRLRGRSEPSQALRIRGDDLHVHRHEEHSPSCLILALDASGSTALHRLAEARGAVQLLLEQSYARRDSVCVIGFRGARAQLLLPMTRSLVRARRALTGLPGGGGTPLASALQMAHAQADQLRRAGVTPILVVLSDGRANVTLAGLGGRLQAQAEAQHWATAWGHSGHASLWIDTAPQPDAQARQLAQQMSARYLPMPQVQTQRLPQALKDARPAR